jgi:hypothetical protein
MLTIIDEKVGIGIPNEYKYFKGMVLTEMRRVLETSIFQVVWDSVASNILVFSNRMINDA